MNILNGTEAFAAMMAGQTVLCRAIGDLIEFDDIGQFPATIFAKCIMKFKYSTITRTLTVFGAKMDHIFHNVSVGEIEELVIDAKFKEALWRK